MRIHLLRLVIGVAAIGVLLFASVAYAQGDDPTFEEDLAELCEEVGGRMQNGTCFIPPAAASCGWEDDPAYCTDSRYEGRVMADPELLDEVLGEGVEAGPETGQTQPAGVQQAPRDLPVTQPAGAQRGSPQYTG